MKVVVIVLLVGLILLAAGSNVERQGVDVVYRENIYFESGKTPNVLSVCSGQRPEDASMDFLLRFQFTDEVRQNIHSQLMAGICGPISNIPDARLCDQQPVSAITLELNLGDFIANAKEKFPEGYTTIEKVHIRQGYSIRDSISCFCAIHANLCQYNDKGSNDSEFLRDFISFAEESVARQSTLDDKASLTERFRSNNYFTVLGLETTATEAEIKAAYKSLARKYHPDKYSEDRAWATEALQIINAAYEVLSDSSRRQQHLLSLQGGQAAGQQNQAPGSHFSTFTFNGGSSFSFSFSFSF